MNSFLKAVLHTALTVAAFCIPSLLIKSGIADISIGTAAAFLLNWLTSHTIATTTGASARQ